MWREPLNSLIEFNSIDYGAEKTELKDINVSELLKLFNLWNLSDIELEKEIYRISWIDINKTIDLKYLQSLYEEALSIYQNTFHIKIRSPFSDYIFRSKSDVTNFLKRTNTSSNTDRRQIYCDLIKITFSLHQIEQHPVMSAMEDYTFNYIQNSFINTPMPQVWRFGDLSLASLANKKKNKDYYEVETIYYKQLPSGWEQEIPCFLRYRWKSRERMVVKMLWNNQQWISINDIIKDGIWEELEPRKNNRDRIYLLEFQYLNLKRIWKEDTFKFRAKPGYFSEEEIEEYALMDDLDEGFRLELLNLDYIVKKAWTMKYQDCKWQQRYLVWKSLQVWIEARTVKKWNKNQSWYAASEIVDWEKTIDAMIWLRWWVSRSYIERIANKVAENQNVEKDRNKILESYIKKYRRVYIPWRSRNIYSSVDRMFEIVENAAEYPRFIVDVLIRELGIKDFNVMELIESVKKAQEEFPKDNSIEKSIKRVRDSILWVID